MYRCGGQTLTLLWIAVCWETRLVHSCYRLPLRQLVCSPGRRHLGRTQYKIQAARTQINNEDVRAQLSIGTNIELHLELS